MENNINKNKVQQSALKSWLKVNKKGSCEIITGLGKTFVALHALYTMPKNNDIHLFLAEVTDRKKDLIDNIKLFNKIFNVDVLNDYNLQFYCYQTVYKWKNKAFGLIIADEIHDSLSPSYSKFYFNNSYKAIIGLSATINTKTRYILSDNIIITKGQLLDQIAPICFSYTIDQGIVDNTTRDLNVYVIRHQLNNTDKYIVAGNIKKRFFQTEKSAYEYWDKEHKKSWFILDEELKQLKIRITSSKRSEILYNLKSKIIIIKKLLNHLSSKTIIFGNSIPSLLALTPNVISSKNSDKKNELIRYNFDNDKINIIGSFKKLKQGANLKGLDNCIIMSYYSTDKDFIQRVGRLRDNGLVGNIFIILTVDTQEEIWFSKMLEDINSLNLIYTNGIDDCIQKLIKNN